VGAVVGCGVAALGAAVGVTDEGTSGEPLWLAGATKEATGGEVGTIGPPHAATTKHNPTRDARADTPRQSSRPAYLLRYGDWKPIFGTIARVTA